MHDYYQIEDYFDGDLKFAQWPDSKGIAVVTGMLREEFVKATRQHLIGVDSKPLGENGTIDEFGADELLAEMYEDSVTRPKLLERKIMAPEDREFEGDDEHGECRLEIRRLEQQIAEFERDSVTTNSVVNDLTKQLTERDERMREAVGLLSRWLTGNPSHRKSEIAATKAWLARHATPEVPENKELQ